MDSADLPKSKAHNIVGTIEYVPDSVVTKSIIKKSTGNISVMSFDRGQGLTDRILAYDTFAQIIDGKAEILIDGNSHNLESGQGIIIPAHISNAIKATEKFKMMLTSLKPPLIRKTRL